MRLRRWKNTTGITMRLEMTPLQIELQQQSDAKVKIFITHKIFIS